MSHELVEGTSKLFSSNFAYHKLRRPFQRCRLDGFMSMTVLYICLSVWGHIANPFTLPINSITNLSVYVCPLRVLKTFI